jgi:Protein-tyrosine-phosphatase
VGRYEKIIFVDEDDNSRSVMAKIIARNKFSLETITIESRGLVVLFQEPINQKAAAVLISKGYHVDDHESKQLEQKDINDAVLILTMEDRQKEKIWMNYENAASVYTLSEYINGDVEIAPLFGEALTEYGRCYEILESLIDALVVRLRAD